MTSNYNIMYILQRKHHIFLQQDQTVSFFLLSYKLVNESKSDKNKTKKNCKEFLNEAKCMRTNERTMAKREEHEKVEGARGRQVNLREKKRWQNSNKYLNLNISSKTHTSIGTYLPTSDPPE